ncbi:flagellar basal body P-ring formation chaperone FlgA [Thiomicrospira sp. ALE5]|uniref:flagellar basal body P-ring formation chaperone FlgA n=1 Tax=Thiomicrospira sp. ALE5 TaxID=748650 RepID=UPI0008E9B47A|nr:flagellar basal body P-ring formation chaperone FlgA [Thiomicrospira sp. ALE5]SFR60144.1 flagella basal body P-ring formation protein FlgA [Thiomicrospira sp. ALE5]
MINSHKRLLGSLTLVLSLILSQTTWAQSNSTSNQASQQDMSQVYQEVEAHLLSALKNFASYPLQNIKIQVRPLPDRLSLAACNQPLNIEHRLNNRFSPRTTVSVQCHEPVWRLFVTAELYAETPVVVASQPILRDAMISSHAVKLELRPLGQIRKQHLHDLEQVVGHRARRPISPNTLISVQMLDPPYLVINNHDVTIITQIGSLEIRTPGVALSNGLAQEQIPVRNTRSDRIVNGIVVAPNTVLVP